MLGDMADILDSMVHYNLLLGDTAGIFDSIK